MKDKSIAGPCCPELEQELAKVKEENEKLKESLSTLSKDYIELNKKISSIVTDLDEAIFSLRKGLIVNSHTCLLDIKNKITTT